jgi:glycosyltransferase involved in cell wall biosynthesis
MNILYVSDSTTVSGAEVVLLGYLDHFRAPEYKTHVFLHEQNHRLAEELDRRNVPWTPTASYSRILLETRLNAKAFVHYASSFRRVTAEMGREIRQHGIDLVHSISYPSSLYAATPARRARIPQVWHEHNIKRIHRVNRHLYRFVARSCSAIVSPSKAVTDNLARAGIAPGKLHTVYNGIDLQRFEVDPAAVAAVRRELGLDERTKSVGLFGQMLPYKGHRTLIEAAPHILQACPDARFFFVGALENPPYQDELRQSIKAAGLAHVFRFCGWRRDVPVVLGAMDVVAVLTTTPEPAALGLMEAMAAGRPVVATRTGGTPEIVVDGENGLLVPPGDAAAVAAGLVRLVQDGVQRSRFGLAGRHRVEREFTLDLHLRHMAALYRDVVSSNRPA